MDSDQRFRKNSLKNIFLINKMNDQIHKSGKKYDNDEDRRQGFLIAQRRYSYKKWMCNVCDCEINLGNKTKHKNSKKHKMNVERKHECLTCTDYESSNNDDL